jgi:hypothetical protein
VLHEGLNVLYALSLLIGLLPHGSPRTPSHTRRFVDALNRNVLYVCMREEECDDSYNAIYEKC